MPIVVTLGGSGRALIDVLVYPAPGDQLHLSPGEVQATNEETLAQQLEWNRFVYDRELGKSQDFTAEPVPLWLLRSMR